jgi:aminopeptidase
MVFETFGEKPFSPENKRESLKLSEEQEELMRSHENNINQIYEKYEPNEKTSFCIIAFPNPEIGEDFENIFEDTLKYMDLNLTFKDGYVADYTCSNFDNEMDNREYVKENLMECHKELPLGEFAIGTNTEAYIMAQKYGIIDVLPVLIIEKMGPHFAIGDTCFSWSEDLPVYNVLNKKEIVARDNDKSILRKQDVSKAYTGVHTDITLPYEEIGFISVITNDGNKIDIIRNGRFVLEGTEELNKPLDN